MFWNPWGVRRHAHLALVHTSIEHSRDWCRSLLILNCQELAAQQPLRPINWCSRLLKMTTGSETDADPNACDSSLSD
ncbi:resolvase [Pseudomonas aeruginosa]|nr:resolvase [Pseudomonas aeruginosa]